MNIKRVEEIRSLLNAAVDRDPMNELTGPELTAAVQSLGPEFDWYIASRDAIQFATEFCDTPLTPDNARARAKEFINERVGILEDGYQAAEAIFSAAGLSDPQAWQAGHLGLFIDWKEDGYYVA